MRETVINTHGLTKQYGKIIALDHVDIALRRGDIYGLVGDNGAGKTTLLKLIAGMIFPSEGELELLGTHTQREQERARRRIGAMIESAAFYEQMTVERNLEYYRIQRGIPGKACVEEAMELTGLIPQRKKLCKKLSMGMKQRLGLAIAMLGEPEILVLDEPINGLDPSGIIEIRNILRTLNEEKNITILLSSHILSELEQIATVYGFLQNGRLKEQVSAKELRGKCRSYIEIAVSDAPSYSVLLEKTYPNITYQILPDQVLHIFDSEKETALYSDLAGKHGISIRRLENHQMTLEEYYEKEVSAYGMKKGGAVR